MEAEGKTAHRLSSEARWRGLNLSSGLRVSEANLRQVTKASEPLVLMSVSCLSTFVCVSLSDFFLIVVKQIKHKIYHFNHF